MMNCPYCNQKMEKGYIDQTDLFHPLVWYPAKRGTGILDIRKGSVNLTKQGSVTAFRCVPCRKILIDEDRLGG